MTISTHCQAAVRALLGTVLVGTLVVLPAAHAHAGGGGPAKVTASGGQSGSGPPAKHASGGQPGGGPGPSGAPDQGPPKSAERSPGATQTSAGPSARPPAGKPSPRVGPAAKTGQPSHARQQAKKAHRHDTSDDGASTDGPTSPTRSAAAPGRVVPTADGSGPVVVGFGRAVVTPDPAASTAPAEAPAPDVAEPARTPAIADRVLDVLPDPRHLTPPLRDPTIPMLLIVALVGYALVVGRGDRRDPKLARSSLDPGSRGIGFK